MRKCISFLCLAALLLTACSKNDETATTPTTTPPAPVLSSEKAITAFSFLKKDNPALDTDLAATISSQKITVDIPAHISERNLVPTFTLSNKAKARIGSTEQVSGQTKNNYTQSLSYEVEAEDKTKATYTVEVKAVGHAPLATVNNTTSYSYRTAATTWIDYGTALPSSLKFYPGGYLARAIYDFDKDGDEDIITGNLNYDEASGTLVNAPRPVHYLNNTGGTYTDVTASKFSGSVPGLVHPRKAILGDFDKNGWMDVVMAGHGYDQPPFPGEKSILLLNHNGIFTSREILPIGFYHSVSSGDIDNDGDIDLFFSDTKSSRFFINDGNANFTLDNTVFPAELYNLNFFTSELFDLNADGYLDVVVTGHEHENAASTVLWGNYTGKYTKARSTTLPRVQGWGIAIDINILDVNGDGRHDIILNRQGDGTGAQTVFHGLYVQVLVQDAARGFTDQTTTIISNHIQTTHPGLTWFWIDWLRLLDADGDGDKDIVTDNKFYNLQWRNNNGSFARF